MYLTAEMFPGCWIMTKKYSDWALITNDRSYFPLTYYLKQKRPVVQSSCAEDMNINEGAEWLNDDVLYFREFRSIIGFSRKTMTRQYSSLNKQHR